MNRAASRTFQRSAACFPRNAVAVITFAVWEEGIVTAPGNPKGIKAIDDLARRDVTIVNREKGAGSRGAA